MVFLSVKPSNCFSKNDQPSSSLGSGAFSSTVFGCIGVGAINSPHPERVELVIGVGAEPKSPNMLSKSLFVFDGFGATSNGFGAASKSPNKSMLAGGFGVEKRSNALLLLLFEEGSGPRSNSDSSIMLCELFVGFGIGLVGAEGGLGRREFETPFVGELKSPNRSESFPVDFLVFERADAKSPKPSSSSLCLRL